MSIIKKGGEKNSCSEKYVVEESQKGCGRLKNGGRLHSLHFLQDFLKAEIACSDPEVEIGEYWMQHGATIAEV